MFFYRRGRRERRGDMGFYRSELRGGMIFLPQRTQRAQGTCFFTAEDAESAEGIWVFTAVNLEGA